MAMMMAEKPNVSRFQTNPDPMEDSMAKIHRLERRIADVQNALDMTEILSNFWPMQNMHDRLQRLEAQQNELFQQRQALLRTMGL